MTGKPLRCPFCLKKFKTAADLSRHILYDAACQKKRRKKRH